MHKNEILNKVEKIEEEQREIIEQRIYEQRCIKHKLCPTCGNNLKEETDNGAVGIIGFWLYYVCNACNYKIEVENYKNKDIIWCK